MEYLAHISDDGRYQTVREHSINTGHLAGQFAAAFGAEEAGRAAGTLHDIGKYSGLFQKRVRGEDIRVDHSTAGMKEAIKLGMLPAAFAIAGHHSGIPDGGSRVDRGNDPTLMGRSRKQIPDYSTWKQELTLSSTVMPEWVIHGADNFTQAFFTRMLYSCLVDADFLDTEMFMQGKQPRNEYDSVQVLLQRLRKATDHWLNGPSDNKLNDNRNRILRTCIQKGREGKTGLYTLSVPTGGGKTISSLSFALEHAVRNHMDRVIYVIPYTSIIDQTSEVFQKILGEGNVLAHYAETDFYLKDREDLTLGEYKKVLASENWDMPVIVTTAVQFFDSLFANRSSKCRKLHNIANSVIIFDEAQTLPVSYLRPCVAAISQLVLHYHTTAVLCTATQPLLKPLFDEFGVTAEEICDNPETVYKELRRVSLKDLGQIAEDNLLQRLKEHPQVLCVVNRRQLAQDLYKEMPEEGAYCLTTLLRPQDRKRKLEEIRGRLKEGLPCRVVSTSLIEAGVDVDFPVAYREEAGLDSLLQTAGRCNREGIQMNPQDCPVYLFRLENVSPPPTMRQQVSALHAVERTCEELDSPEAVECYFSVLLYKIKDMSNLDQYGVLEAFRKGVNGRQFPFASVAKDFSLIREASKTIYIPAEEGALLCEQLLSGNRSRGLFRKLGAYSVSVYDQQYQDLYRAGLLQTVDTESAVLSDLSYYDENTGLKTQVSSGQALFL